MNRKRGGRALRLALVVPMLFGVGAVELAGQVRDSAGVAIVEASVPAASWTLSDAPLLQIGLVDGDERYLLSGVRFAARLEDGRVAVANGSTREVRFYDADGAFRSALGGRGAGPGEFQAITTVRLTPGDTLVIHDLSTQRLTWISPDEALARTSPLWNVPGSLGAGGFLGVLADGRAAVVPRFQLGAAPPSRYTFRRDTLRVLAVAEGRQAEVLASGPGHELLHFRFEVGSGFGIALAPLPFAYTVLAAVVDGSVWIGRTDRFEVRSVDAQRRLRGVTRVATPPAPIVTPAVIERIVERTGTSARTRGADAEAAMQEARDQLGALPPGRPMPVFDLLLPSVHGDLWVRDFMAPDAQDEPQRWTVIGADGVPRARVTTPADLQLTHVGPTHVTGVWRDALGVEYVRVYRTLTD